MRRSRQLYAFQHQTEKQAALDDLHQIESREGAGSSRRFCNKLSLEKEKQAALDNSKLAGGTTDGVWKHSDTEETRTPK